MKNTKYKRNSDIVFYAFDTEAYLLDEKNDEVITLNETTKDLWGYLEKPVSVPELIKLFIQKYSASQTEIQTDIERIIKLFMQKKLVTKIDTK